MKNLRIAVTERFPKRFLLYTRQPFYNAIPFRCIIQSLQQYLYNFKGFYLDFAVLVLLFINGILSSVMRGCNEVLISDEEETEELCVMM